MSDETFRPRRPQDNNSQETNETLEAIQNMRNMANQENDSEMGQAPPLQIKVIYLHNFNKRYKLKKIQTKNLIRVLVKWDNLIRLQIKPDR